MMAVTLIKLFISLIANVGGLRVKQPNKNFKLSASTEAWKGSVSYRHQLWTSIFPQQMWSSLYPDTEPMAPERLPECGKKLKVFVYQLPPKFHADLLSKAESARNISQCGWERGPCWEKKRDQEYSTMRSYAAEVPMLAKFLMMPHVTSNANEADIFVVPWFGATAQWVLGDPWGGKSQEVKEHVQELLSELTHFHGKRQRRHIFLSSRDAEDISPFLRSTVRNANAVLFHYGPRAAANELVMAPNSAGFGAPLSLIANQKPGHFLFLMAGEVNEHRKLMNKEVSRLKKEHPELHVEHLQVIEHRDFEVTLEEVQNKMRDSMLCPIPQGDLPWQHRFFDALASGCLPVMIRYTDKSGCDMWSWDGGLNDTMAWDGMRACVNDTYPFPKTTDYSSITLQVDSADFKEGKFAEALLRMSNEELQQKRNHLELLRGRFLYDWSGKTADAFTYALEEVCALISDPQ